MQKNAITPKREENFPNWYQEVIKAADLAENSPVRGCMTIKPYGYAIWENIQKEFDKILKQKNVQNAYFPLLIPISFFTKEADHIEGFAKECAVVTHTRLEKDEKGNLIPAGKLEEGYVIRPTSETIIGNSIASWINSYRDLPLKLNQWCNVMRWEKRTRIFLRSSEFLWQEGHTIFATEEEAQNDAKEMLQAYVDFARKYAALPIIEGEKTPEEKFPGAKNTYTFESMMQDGKALQAGTSHYLGQTFAKAFNIKFLNKDNKEQIAYTASWGISTRIIGGIIMAHSDDDGLILPPKLAPYQIVIIPIINNKEDLDKITSFSKKVKIALETIGTRVIFDNKEENNSDKIWKWIKKGVPIRIEIGKKEAETNSLTIAKRITGKVKYQINSIDELLQEFKQGFLNLDIITETMLKKAENYMKENTKEITSLKELDDLFAGDFKGFALIDTSKTNTKEYNEIAEKYSLSRRCMPLEFNGKKVIIAKAY